jgi:hypothetical protein
MIIIFISSLVLIIILFSIKIFELHKNKKTVITQKITQGDKPIKRFFFKLKKEISYITWKNFILLMIFIYSFFHNKIILLKRSFDSRQPRFLIASTPEALNQKNDKKPSNFLRTISEHKNNKDNRNKHNKI